MLKSLTRLVSSCQILERAIFYINPKCQTLSKALEISTISALHVCLMFACLMMVSDGLEFCFL